MIFLTKYKNYFLPIFLALFFLTEAWSTIKVGVWGFKSYTPAAIKLLSMGLIVVFILNFKKKYIWPLISLFIIFCLGQLALQNSFEFAVIVSFIKYIFFLLITLYFIKINDAKISRLVFSIFEVIVTINSCIIFLAYLFNWEIFASYSIRFGYSGLFMASATSSYFYCIAIAYFLIKYKVHAFKKPVFYLSITAVFLLGTKTALLYLIFSLALFFTMQIKEVKKKIGLLVIFFLVGGSSLYFVLQRGIFKNITNEKGWVTSIMSYRDQLIVKDTIPYIQENWNSFNYILGGLSELTVRSQMEFLDLLLFFGPLGSFLYLFFLCWFSKLKNIKANSLAFLLIMLLFSGAFISGNFFYNGSTSIYFVVLVLTSLDTLEKNSINNFH